MKTRTYQVVGVVASVKNSTLVREAEPAISTSTSASSRSAA